MDIFGILDPDPHENLCGSETLIFFCKKERIGNIFESYICNIIFCVKKGLKTLQNFSRVKQGQISNSNNDHGSNPLSTENLVQIELRYCESMNLDTKNP